MKRQWRTYVEPVYGRGRIILERGLDHENLVLCLCGHASRTSWAGQCCTCRTVDLDAELCDICDLRQP